jgi:hypothetical protein
MQMRNFVRGRQQAMAPVPSLARGAWERGWPDRAGFVPTSRSTSLKEDPGMETVLIRQLSRAVHCRAVAKKVDQN